MREPELLGRPDWQMQLGERAALEGLLFELRPELAIEIGTAAGGSLERIAAHSAEVHAIDITDEALTGLPANATFHRGDSRTVLPELLAELAAEGRSVDFAIVDGDHSAEGARGDIEALLDSPAVTQTVILVHDSFNPLVRAGIEAVGLGNHPKVAGFDLDFVPGRVGRAGSLDDHLVGGFAFVIVDAARREAGGVELGYWSLKPDLTVFHDAYAAAARTAAIVGGEADATPRGAVRLAPEDVEAAALWRELESVRNSLSWRITAPLRAVGARIRRKP